MITDIKELAEISYWTRVYCEEKRGAYFSDRNFEMITKRYCKMLQIQKDTYKGKVIMDVGCGPRGTLHNFEAKTKYGVEPLAKAYDYLFKMGGKQDMIYLASGCEEIPLLDKTVDVILSVNSLDHVDNLEQTLDELWRILKPGGEIRFNLNLQPEARVTEPHAFTEKEILTKLKKFKPVVMKKFPIEDAVPFERILVIGGKN